VHACFVEFSNQIKTKTSSQIPDAKTRRNLVDMFYLNKQFAIFTGVNNNNYKYQLTR